MTAESTLWAQIRRLRSEREELRFEKCCALAFAALLLLYGIVHFAIEHAPI